MERFELVKESVLSLEKPVFDSLKVALGDYIVFSFISVNQITPSILAEKLCDYFEKLAMKTNRPLDKQIEAYMNDLDSIVGYRIARAMPAKNGEKPILPRSRRFYDKAVSIKNAKKQDMQSLVDYTRIMMCLYMSIIKNEGKEISDVNFSAKALQIDRLIASLKAEKVPLPLNLGKRDRFDLKDIYQSDSGTFVLLIVLLHCIKNTVD